MYTVFLLLFGGVVSEVVVLAFALRFGCCVYVRVWNGSRIPFFPFSITADSSVSRFDVFNRLGPKLCCAVKNTITTLIGRGEQCENRSFLPSEPTRGVMKIKKVRVGVRLTRMNE